MLVYIVCSEILSLVLWQVWQSLVAALPWFTYGGPHSCVTFLSMGLSFYIGHHCSFLALPLHESPLPWMWQLPREG